MSWNFSLFHLLQSVSEAQPEHYPILNGGSFLWVKATRAEECMELHLQSYYTHSWQVKGKMLALGIPYETDYKKESPILNVHKGLN